MAKLKLRGKELLALGYPQGKVVGLAINSALENHRRTPKEAVLRMLSAVLAAPEDFTEDAVWGRVAEELVGPKPADNVYELVDKVGDYSVYGAEQIDANTHRQMETAMRLPVTVAGALMPDAHVGYGLPIGGVLATDNAVIPYAVGNDIGCRMALSLYDVDTRRLTGEAERFRNLLLENSRFGREEFSDPWDDAILADAAFKEIPIVKSLHDRARRQIGSSGGGNHFVEFGEVELLDADNEFGLPPGKYLGLLTHSGSRGLGANIANYYTKLAMEHTVLPREAQHLAWLDLDSGAGAEYWTAMQLAGAYASACHDHIHRRVARALGETPAARVENHHNFAWRQTLADGREAIVHRKGATPAGAGVLGIIPGSMTAPGYIVRGRGAAGSLLSASHGAGRAMSRTQARESISGSELRKQLADRGVTLIGGGLDEAPDAYKDIGAVMAEQTALVEVVGRFQPRVVRME